MGSFVRGHVGAALVAAAVLAVGVTAVATGAIPGSDGTIQACYGKSTGVVRIVDASASCQPVEDRVAWNQKGAEGPAGPAGPAGPRGADGACTGTRSEHVVGADGEPAFENGWADDGNPDIGPARFIKDACGYVHLEGALRTPGGESVAFTLPPGYRPAKYRLTAQLAGNQYGTASVQAGPDGTVFVRGMPGAGTFVMLAGLEFEAAN